MFRNVVSALTPFLVLSSVLGGGMVAMVSPFPIFAEEVECKDNHECPPGVMELECERRIQPEFPVYCYEWPEEDSIPCLGGIGTCWPN